MGEFNVGDRVYHVVRGVGVVVLTPANGTVYVDREDGCPLGIYTSDGYFSKSDANPSILTISEAKAKGYDVPKVMKKVTKEVKAWANLYKGELPGYHPDKRSADRLAAAGRIACVELTGTYEVEEEV